MQPGTGLPQARGGRAGTLGRLPLPLLTAQAGRAPWGPGTPLSSLAPARGDLRGAPGGGAGPEAPLGQRELSLARPRRARGEHGPRDAWVGGPGPQRRVGQRGPPLAPEAAGPTAPGPFRPGGRRAHSPRPLSPRGGGRGAKVAAAPPAEAQEAADAPCWQRSPAGARWSLAAEAGGGQAALAAPPAAVQPAPAPPPWGRGAAAFPSSHPIPCRVERHGCRWLPPAAGLGLLLPPPRLSPCLPAALRRGSAPAKGLREAEVSGGEGAGPLLLALR